MEISDETKKYVVVFGILAFIIYALYDASADKFSCDSWTSDIRNNTEFHMIFQKKENNHSRDTYLSGIDLYGNKPTQYHDGGGWLDKIIDQIQVGDTLIKKIGKYDIIVKRRFKSFEIPINCGNKIYTDK